jgi:hypothetical protein
VRGRFVATGNAFSHFTQEFLGILYHQPIRNAQQLDPSGSEIVFLRRVLPHLAGLRVHPSVKFDGQSMFEAVEIDDPVLKAALAAELRTQLSAAQETPRRSFGLSLVVSEFANALGWDAHGPSIAGLGEWSETLLQPELTPHPSRNGWKIRRRGTPSPPGRGLLIRVVDSRRLTGMTGVPHDAGA